VVSLLLVFVMRYRL